MITPLLFGSLGFWEITLIVLAIILLFGVAAGGHGNQHQCSKSNCHKLFHVHTLLLYPLWEFCIMIPLRVIKCQRINAKNMHKYPSSSCCFFVLLDRICKIDPYNPIFPLDIFIRQCINIHHTIHFPSGAIMRLP